MNRRGWIRGFNGQERRGPVTKTRLLPKSFGVEKKTFEIRSKILAQKLFRQKISQKTK